MLTGVFHLHEQEARQVMTPIPAVVTVDLSRDRPGRAAALRLDRPLAAGRDRGREPGPGQGDRPRQPAGQADDGRGLRGPLRPAGAGGADRARDQAARRPAGRPAARADRAGDRDRRVRAHGRDRHHRGHHRGGRGGDRRRDRSRPAARSGGWPTATGSSAATSRSPTSRTTACTCRSTPTPTTRSAGSCSPSSGACPSAATRWPPTATRSASSRCARTGSRRSGSAGARPAPRPPADRERPEQPGRRAAPGSVAVAARARIIRYICADAHDRWLAIAASQTTRWLRGETEAGPRGPASLSEGSSAGRLGASGRPGRRKRNRPAGDGPVSCFWGGGAAMRYVAMGMLGSRR